MSDDELKDLAHQLIGGLDKGIQTARLGCAMLIAIPPAIFTMGGPGVVEKAAEMQAAARVLIESINAVNKAAADADAQESAS